MWENLEIGFDPEIFCVYINSTYFGIFYERDKFGSGLQCNYEENNKKYEKIKLICDSIATEINNLYKICEEE